MENTKQTPQEKSTLSNILEHLLLNDPLTLPGYIYQHLPLALQ